MLLRTTLNNVMANMMAKKDSCSLATLRLSHNATAMSLLTMHLNWVAKIGIVISCLPNGADILALKAFFISGRATHMVVGGR